MQLICGAYYAQQWRKSSTEEPRRRSLRRQTTAISVRSFSWRSSRPRQSAQTVVCPGVVARPGPTLGVHPPNRDLAVIEASQEEGAAEGCSADAEGARKGRLENQPGDQGRGAACSVQPAQLTNIHCGYGEGLSLHCVESCLAGLGVAPVVEGPTLKVRYLWGCRLLGRGHRFIR